MKDREPKPLTERQKRLQALPSLAQVYVMIGDSLPRLEDENVRLAMQDQQTQMFNRMNLNVRAQLMGYQQFVAAEQKKPVIQHDMNDHI